MAILPSGTWAKSLDEPETSVSDRRFFSGVLTALAGSYGDDHKHVFGFSAPWIKIQNLGPGQLVLQWPTRSKSNNATAPGSDPLVDHDVIEAGDFVVYTFANKIGVNARGEGSTPVYYVSAIG